jgi:hypothetical protein
MGSHLPDPAGLRWPKTSIGLAEQLVFVTGKVSVAIKLSLEAMSVLSLRPLPVQIRQLAHLCFGLFERFCERRYIAARPTSASCVALAYQVILFACPFASDSRRCCVASRGLGHQCSTTPAPSSPIQLGYQVHACSLYPGRSLGAISDTFVETATRRNLAVIRLLQGRTPLHHFTARARMGSSRVGRSARGALS